MLFYSFRPLFYSEEVDEKGDVIVDEPFTDPYLVEDLDLIDPELVLNNPQKPVSKWTIRIEDGINFYVVYVIL